MTTAIVAIVVGGLGGDQTAKDLQPALIRAGARVVSPGQDGVPAGRRGDFDTDVVTLLKTAINSVAIGADDVRLVAIGHSFGAEKVCEVIGQLYRTDHLQFDYVGLLDPISFEPFWAKQIVVQAPALAKGGVDVLYRSWGGLPPKAKIVDSLGRVVADPDHSASMKIPGGHNDVCHKPEAISTLVNGMLRAIAIQDAGPAVAGGVDPDAA